MIKQKQLVQVARGLATFIPGSQVFIKKKTGGTDTARYCYSVWLRHLVMARQNGLSTNPKMVGELGPGDSIGIGLAALLSGAEKYVALDLVRFADLQRNLGIFEDLVHLFRNREDIPGEREFPEVKPRLKSYAFPCDILSDQRLSVSLDDLALHRIRHSIIASNSSESIIRYVAPWYDAGVSERETVDMLYSQAVMEHVDDLSFTYRTLYDWLKFGGYMSHQIDFQCHGTAEEWNGHWMYSDFTWKLIRGNRLCSLNREPHSTHLKLLDEIGFRVACDITVKSPSRLKGHDLALRFRHMSEDDKTTSGAFIQAEKVMR